MVVRHGSWDRGVDHPCRHVACAIRRGPKLMAAGITLGGWLTLGRCQGLENDHSSAPVEGGGPGR